MAEERRPKIRIGVIFGGVSGEHEISLLSARSVLAALDLEKYIVTQIGITHEGSWFTGENVLDALVENCIEALTPIVLLPDPSVRGIYTLKQGENNQSFDQFIELDLLYPVLHGTFGEDGTIQGLFEIANWAYVGSGVAGSSVGMDKAIFKDVLRANNIPVVESIVLNRSLIESNLDEAVRLSEEVARYPIFVKPVNLGSSVGVSKCKNRGELKTGLLDAARYDRRILVERGVNAREIEVAVLGNENAEASIPGEIIPADEFYSYDAKYHNDASQTLIPADLPTEIQEKAMSLAVASFLAIDAAGMARVDFLLDRETNDLYVNEINTLPGFTRISMYPKLWLASGFSYPGLVDRLIDLAMQRKKQRDVTTFRYYREAK